MQGYAGTNMMKHNTGRGTASRRSSWWRWMSAVALLMTLPALSWVLRPAAPAASPASSVDAAPTVDSRPVPVIAVMPSGGPVASAALLPESQPTQDTAVGGSGSGEDTLFLTIVGDQTDYRWGRAGDRPPRIDGRAAASRGGWLAAVSAAEADAGVSAAATAGADEYDGLESPYGPAPQECPRTLPAGSTQTTADELRGSSGCRYLSSCSVENDTEQCTWFYQGRG